MPKHLTDMMVNFYLCSHLPIAAFNAAHKRINAVGHTSSSLSQLMVTLDHYDPNTHTIDPTSLPITLESATPGLIYTICPIYKEHFETGYFVIGPYTTDLELRDLYLFKPSHCMGPLIELLYTIRTVEAPLSPLHLQPEIDDNSVSSDEHSYHVTKATQYIRAHYAEPITLDELANYLALNKSYFCTIFKKVTKHSFSAYLNMVRINESKKLLMETSLSMLDIALSVGFSSASYFNTTFKKYVGMTPLEYRNLSTKQ